MPLTFGGQPVKGTRAATVKPADADALTPQQSPLLPGVERNAIARHSDRQAALAELPASAVDVLMFFRMVALVLEARRRLRYAVAAVREIDIDALNDPALESHPRRPAMLHEYEARRDQERLAVIALAEQQNGLAALWDRLAPEDINRYALTTLIGETDPDMQIDTTLWCDDRGLSKLEPFPDDWTIPHDIAHRAFDPGRARFGVQTYDADELLNSPQPSF